MSPMRLLSRLADLSAPLLYVAAGLVGIALGLTPVAWFVVHYRPAILPLG